MTALVFVHGFMGGSEQWALQRPLGEGRDLICVDLPGFGKNAHLEPIASIDGYAEWVLQELSRRGIERFDLLGHSMGGMIAQAIVHQAPERIARLVLYGTGPKGVMPGRFETIEVSKQRAQADGPAATAQRIAATWFLRMESASQYRACADIAVRAELPALLAGLDAMQGWAGEEHLSAIRAETLILWGDGDRAYAWPQVEMLWRGVSGSHLAVVPNCSHAVHMERPEIFNLLVNDFLSEE